ncbi:hypothetical protein ACF0H5_011187 [Mactra antiquata]
MASVLVRSYSGLKNVLCLSMRCELRYFHRAAWNMLYPWKPSALKFKVQQNLSDVPLRRNLHTSPILCKKLNEELYERFKIYDHHGDYLCTTELYIVEKFCYRFHRFSFEKIETVPDGSDGLRSIKLIEPQKSKTESAEKRVKTIKFKKDASGDAKMPKIMESLINTEKVMLVFEKKGCKAEPEVKDKVSKFAEMSFTVNPDGSSQLYAQLKTLDSQLLGSLMETVQTEHGKHIADVQDLLKVVKQSK